MEKDFVAFDIAKKLKEKGFQIDEPYAMYNELGVFHKLFSSAGYYDYYSYNDFDERDCIAPTIAQALKWLREEKNFHIEIISAAYGYVYVISRTPDFGGTDIRSSEYKGPNEGGAWDEWEDCVTNAIEYVIDNSI